MKNARLLLLIFLVLLPAIVYSQIPRTISYQGVLTDDLGNPKPNGRYLFTFKLYDVSSGGVALWTQAESLQVERGLFSSLLGQTPFGPSMLFDKQYWLGIQVNADLELAPRVKLSSVGYSLNSAHADTAEYSRVAPSGGVADSARIAGTIPNNSITSAKILNGTVQFADIAQNGAAVDQIMKWNGVIWTPRNDSVGTLGVSSQWTTLGSDIYYNLGNVGIGDTNYPSYKLDVLHTGSTGIRSRSSASFSVVDIDAFSGDAALRFQKAGIGQWNIRNRPSDDYLEIFELGGGGSRMVIQDATGNVGIGETTAPSYKLDVLHAGSTGIRSRSSASFSVVDIDANSGDAALRFAKAGVNQWNIRNRPGDDYLEIFELGGGGSRMVIQDATGNVGIGETTSPSYKLDVLHGGSTGARIKSSSSFSVVDIDAASGDAALRFQKAGVNMWNIRNRPSDDNLEIFELGGGGSRVVIEDSTGFFGINTSNPTAQLEVTAGATRGIYGTSSILSNIDGAVYGNNTAGPTAALATQNNGIYAHSTVSGGAAVFGDNGYSNTVGYAGYFAGRVHVSGTLSKSAGSFKIDHPIDPENKYLSHSFVESPDMMNIYNGNIVTDATGKAVVSLPEYFEALNMDYRYQLTAIGSFAQAIISKKVQNNQFEIATSLPNVEVSWQVTGIRNDAYAKKNRIPNVEDKESVNRGKYLNPESFNLPATRGIDFAGQTDGSVSQTQTTSIPQQTQQTVIETGGSLDQAPATQTVPKSVENSGSVANTDAVKAVTKPADNSGSVLDTPNDKR
ncbi:MAG: hypothetical protein HZB59_05265 [Ignavibacteriales bacterium]|nr:hypothetical protein [Ignavibacteriales bacterium]